MPSTVLVIAIGIVRGAHMGPDIVESGAPSLNDDK